MIERPRVKITVALLRCNAMIERYFSLSSRALRWIKCYRTRIPKMALVFTDVEQLEHWNDGRSDSAITLAKRPFSVAGSRAKGAYLRAYIGAMKRGRPLGEHARIFSLVAA